MFFLAYDGTIHGDWVANYAIRLASHHPDHELHLLHVAEGSLHPRQLDDKLAHLEAVCRQRAVTLRTTIIRTHVGVFDALAGEIPDGVSSYLVCGTRSRKSKVGILSGTVPERLLRANRFHVLAIRVNQPGLLGLPKTALIPIAGHPRGFRSGMPFLRLFHPDISRLHLCFVQRVSSQRFRLLSQDAAERLRLIGQAYCQRIEQELTAELGVCESIADANVVVSDNVPREIVLMANKTKSRLIYLGATERSVPERFFYGNPVEQVLRNATCDVAVYRGVP